MTTADIQSLAEAVRSGDRRALSRAITLIESTRTDHRQASNSLLELLMPHTGGAYSFARAAMGPWGGFITGFAETIDRLARH